MSDSSNSASSSFPILGILGVVFIVLKLTHVINWSWLWVLAPFWGGLALWLIVLVVAFAIIAATDKR
jgi:hypothetical protein